MTAGAAESTAVVDRVAPWHARSGPCHGEEVEGRKEMVESVAARSPVASTPVGDEDIGGVAAEHRSPLTLLTETDSEGKNQAAVCVWGRS